MKYECMFVHKFCVVYYIFSKNNSLTTKLLTPKAMDGFCQFAKFKILFTEVMLLHWIYAQFYPTYVNFTAHKSGFENEEKCRKLTMSKETFNLIKGDDN